MEMNKILAEGAEAALQVGQGTGKRCTQVTAAACPDYREEYVSEAVGKVLESWQGFSKIRPGTKVAVKVNLVSGSDPEKAVTTHPMLVTEVCRRLISKGADVVVGDSPGGLFTEAALKKNYRAGGLEMVEAVGAKLNYNTDIEEVKFPEAVSAHVFSCTSWLRQADLIIDFTKLKTHAMMGMTASVKNMFGSIPGTTKPEYHMRFPETKAFANMLVDLNESLRPAFSMIDAVDCMEGNGPTSGTPRHLGLVLGSENPYYLDMVCAELIGLTREDVPTLQCAFERGLGPEDVSSVPVEGEDIEKWKIADFQPAAKVNITFTPGGPLGKAAAFVFTQAMQQVPKVAPAECVGCRKCYHVCPAHAISMVNDKPHIDRKRCIHCFCCQEFCPKGAMKVHRTWLARILQS